MKVLKILLLITLLAASRTLEMLIEHPDTPEPLREKSWFLAAKLLEKMQLHEAAQGYY